MAGKSLLPPPAGACIVTSYVKSGRTWLRFMLAAYLADIHGLGPVDLHSLFTIVPNNDDDPQRGRAAFGYGDRPSIPRVLCEHLPWKPFDGSVNPTVVMVRSPLDTIVSRYFMESRQNGRREQAVGDYLRSPRGAAAWIEYHNQLIRKRSGPGVTWISYEQLTHDPAGTFGRVLEAFSIPCDQDAAGRAIAAAAFDRMAELEAETGFPGNAVDPADLDARRMREGRIGAGAGHLAEEDRLFVARTIHETLDPAARGRLESLGCIL
ncbi:sulfotransferase domain-containing protein [Stella humosa]|uniref:Sulfotransferase domain-containing protein n=1 Tax=Stella humosa TaxID=94 RepID=A0A3N1KSQ4_9PROT|nr:sulfotransferase domain-containing protein [Stella humosa]ROP81146.1 sulfotransferase domain-containing protein [Stella humosa]BBK32491.1 sulfotransferase [Stella humosa]